MKWTRGGRSRNLEDAARRSGGGGRPGMKLGIGGFLLLAVLSLDIQEGLLRPRRAAEAELGPSADVSTARAPAGGAVSDPQEEELVEFVSFVLDDAQATWTKLLPAVGKNYVDAKLVLFRDGVESACGYAGSASGPVLLPRRPEGLHRPRLLPGAEGPLRRARRLRPGLRHRPRDRAPRPAPPRDRPGRARSSQAADPRNENASRSPSSSRPTASPASGATRRRSAGSSRGATSRRG